MRNKDEREEKILAGVAFVQMVLFWLCVIAIVGVSYWSFDQTYKFVAEGSYGWHSIYVAMAIQYLQNVFLFMATIYKDKTWRITHKLEIPIRDMLYAGFGVLAFIDAGTNVGQWRSDNPDLASTVNVYSVTWQLICVVVIFVEEALAIAVSAAVMKTSEFLKTFGFGETARGGGFNERERDERSSNSGGNGSPFGHRPTTPFGGGKKRGPKSKGGGLQIGPVQIGGTPKNNGADDDEIRKLLGM